VFVILPLSEVERGKTPAFAVAVAYSSLQAQKPSSQPKSVHDITVKIVVEREPPARHNLVIVKILSPAKLVKTPVSSSSET
jgi:hypothetical protein